jgi:hypothetical protein
MSEVDAVLLAGGCRRALEAGGGDTRAVRLLQGFPVRQIFGGLRDRRGC